MAQTLRAERLPAHLRGRSSFGGPVTGNYVTFAGIAPSLAFGTNDQVLFAFPAPFPMRLHWISVTCPTNDAASVDLNAYVNTSVSASGATQLNDTADLDLKTAGGAGLAITDSTSLTADDGFATGSRDVDQGEYVLAISDVGADGGGGSAPANLAWLVVASVEGFVTGDDSED